MLSNENIQALDEKYVLHTYKRMPGVFVRGKGCYLYDENGKEYLDFLAGIAVCQLGHCHPAVVKAITEQAQTLLHTSNYLVTEPQARLAKKLCEISGMDKVFFTTDGTTANETALKIAKKHGLAKRPDGDYEIISLNNSFHGRSLGSLSATAQPRYQDPFKPLLPNFKSVPINDVAALRNAFSDKTAAFTFEPIQGEGGVMPVTAEYAREARDLAYKHNALLIVDEVQCGLGRTGHWFVFQHLGVEPDILCLAKALGGGLPVGACLTRGDAAHILKPGDHGSTYGGNPISTCTGLAVLETIEKENLLENAIEMGNLLQSGFKKLGPIVEETRGSGLMIGIRLSKPIARDVVAQALDLGLITNATDEWTLRLVPPLTVNAAEVQKALSIFENVLTAQLATAR
ncbi:MAG TPA: acetylornithine transaminase [Fimbriimonadaceae bacterium]|jgi:predicted acetylornithine/succinylornithine family transaminase